MGKRQNRPIGSSKKVGRKTDITIESKFTSIEDVHERNSGEHFEELKFLSAPGPWFMNKIKKIIQGG